MLQLFSKSKSKPGLPKDRIQCRKEFLYYFPKGFADHTFLEWERNYKWQAHIAWESLLNQEVYQQLVASKQYNEISLNAVRVESKTNLLFSFEKMALRDAIKTVEGSKLFALGLYDYVYGSDALQKRFEKFAEVLSSLPRKQTRVLTWPLQTVFGFIARPEEHIFIKPRVTKTAADKYGYGFTYKSKPNWATYKSMIGFAEQVRDDMKDLKPRDYIDLQSFIWIMGSDEYPD